MKALKHLNPFIWRHKGRLLLGIVFIAMTNVFAVWAPSMIGEGVNALKEAYDSYLVPLDEGQSMEAIQATTPFPFPPT